MKTIIKNTLPKAAILTAIVASAFTVNYLFAQWSGPSDTPPNANEPAPVNVSGETQQKDGLLTLFGGFGVFGPFQVDDGTAATGSVLVSTDGAGNTTWMSTTSLGLIADGGDSSFFHVQHRVSGGSNGGTLSSGSWQTRPLTDVVDNDISGASLSGNQITLPAGTYTVTIRSEVGGSKNVGNHQARLRNVTDGVTLLSGSQGRISRGDSVNFAAHLESWVSGRFSINNTKTIELQHRSQGNGYFGISADFGEEVVYADLIIEKE